MASKLAFYNDPISQPCRSVQMFLQVNKIDYEDKFLSLFNGDYRKSEELAAINPSIALPAIKDAHVQLFESDAILRYLASQYKVADHWYPSAVAKRARIDEYLAWHHGNTRQSCIGLFRQLFLTPKFFNKVPEEKEVEEAKKKLNKTADFLENYFLKDTKFINSDEISIADLLAVCEFTQLHIVDYNVGEGRPKVALWIQNIRSELGSVFNTAHKIVHKFREEAMKKS